MLNMTLLGDALLELTEAVRINYPIFGDAALHAHVTLRYSSEPKTLRRGPPSFYDYKDAPKIDPAPNRDAALISQPKKAITERLYR